MSHGAQDLGDTLDSARLPTAVSGQRLSPCYNSLPGCPTRAYYPLCSLLPFLVAVTLAICSGERQTEKQRYSGTIGEGGADILHIQATSGRRPSPVSSNAYCDCGIVLPKAATMLMARACRWLRALYMCADGRRVPSVRGEKDASYLDEAPTPLPTRRFGTKKATSTGKPF